MPVRAPASNITSVTMKFFIKNIDILLQFLYDFPEIFLAIIVLNPN